MDAEHRADDRRTDGGCTRVFILADDLTGAADAANYFRTGAHRVRVGLNPDRPWDPALGPEVVQVADTESRAAAPAEARARVAAAVEQLKALFSQEYGASYVYKKVDSTLRGHLGAELETALQALERRVAVLAPSFPANGRCVLDGRLTVHGTPVHETAFAKDPRNPIDTDRIADLVRRGVSIPVREMPIPVVRSGPEAARAWVDKHHEKHMIVVADAQTEDDLSTLASAFAARQDVLLCGSAGLAKHLPPHWLRRGEGVSSAAPVPADQVLVLVGSANPVAHRQLEALAESTGLEVAVLDPVRLADAASSQDELAMAARRLAAGASGGGRVHAAALGQRRPATDTLRRFEDDLAAVAKAWFETVDARRIGFVATGGDTALALCRAIGVQAIWPEGEVLAGIPWNTIETPRGSARLVTKAGGFGEDDALRRAVDFLTRGAGS
ncbi:four-carbon acid sugar kinase family protein [Alicyclobacillus sp.]|uniref:four-carbon acid sugar kinase family protein n=1 Tax=Alicyclobacillus sp. TaxID=61169 RepID=UPI0025BCC07B|nr:four-carbon acid sugar kinase family protein [Alicyclobacillus sp.]MCL6517933.1 hypothetical protein [Alicyclobacillus sp.]